MLTLKGRKKREKTPQEKLSEASVEFGRALNHVGQAMAGLWDAIADVIHGALNDPEVQAALQEVFKEKDCRTCGHYDEHIDNCICGDENLVQALQDGTTCAAWEQRRESTQ